ncbi:hypothetical protein [Limosilactobacillus reuteri]|uniref:hypothetical protein n=1 Tax=Limosilactobacillus reuteri TaxID=1598 RepID=UPI002B054036|nr:hypothetical protein [Limosilactobacillus reuteri]
MSNKRIEDINITQKSVNDFLNSLEGKRVLMNLKYLIKGYKPIKRTRKRQIMKRKKNGEPMYDYYDVHKSVNYDIRDTIGWQSEPSTKRRE